MTDIDLNSADEAIIEELREGRNTPSNLARRLDYSREYVSQRLKRLREHNLVNRPDRGLYELTEKGIAAYGLSAPSESVRPEPRPTPGGEPSSEGDTSDEPDDTATGGAEAALAAVEFPQGKDTEACIEAVLAARAYLQERGSATMREIVTDVMPDHSLGYEVPDLGSGDRYRGAWWRRIVKPGLEALPSVEKPPRGGSEWRYVNETGQ